MIPSAFQFITVILITLYIPWVCYSDWKTRTFNFAYFTPLIIWGIFTTYTYLIESPPRNFYLMGITICLCAILLIESLVFKAFGGADFFFASFIMIFVQYNPFVIPRSFFALDFFWTLMVITVTLPLVSYAYNLLEYHRPKTLLGMFKFPDGMPFMIPISVAFLTTIILEMFV